MRSNAIELRELSEWADWFPLKDGSPVDRLAASVFVNCSHPGGRLMANFTAFFDASGNAQKQPYVIVSGYIANYLQWKLFEKSWSRSHADFGMQLPFHMADFIAALENPKYAAQRNARADYIEIAKDPKKAEDFLKSLAMVQLSTVVCGVSAIVDMDVYLEVSSLLDLREVVPPYALGARMCLAKIHKWEDEFAISNPVECIFEEGDFEQGKFTALMIDEGQPVPIYKKKKDFAGLQAADQYAWEQYHFLSSHKIDPDTIPRQAFHALLHLIPKLHTHATHEVLINLCHAKGINPATGIRK